MTKNPKKPASVIETFYRTMEEVNSELETVLSDYEPKDQELAIILRYEENRSLEYLKKERINTEPRKLVERYRQLDADDDEIDLFAIRLRKWFFCRQARYYLENDDAELAAKSVARLSWESLRTVGLVDQLKKGAQTLLNQQKTLFGRLAKKRIRAERLALLIHILKSEGHTAASIEKRYNTRTVVFNKLNEALEKKNEKLVIKRDQFNKDISYLRDHAPADVFGEQ